MEIVKLISFCFYDIKRYFTESLNYWNWLVLITVFIYQFVFLKAFESKSEPESDFSKVFSVLVLLGVFYKGFNMFRMFDSLAPFVGIVNSIMGNISNLSN